MVGMADNRDSARKGKAVEHLVAATCILASGLKLNVSTSLVDDEGVDLVFHRRGQSTTLAVQVKSRMLTASTIAKREMFRANVGANTFRPRRDLYMLFVAVNASEGTFPFAWFVPSEWFAQQFAKPNSQNRFAFTASTKTTSKDRWSEFRCERADLADRVLMALEGLA